MATKQMAAKPKTQTGRDEKALPLHADARRFARLGLAVGVLALAVWMASDFLPALGWALILAIATAPAYTRFRQLFAGSRAPELAPVLFTLLIGLVVLAPITLALHQLGLQSEAAFSWIAQVRDKGAPVPEWVAQLPLGAEAVRNWWNENLTEPQGAAAFFDRLNAGLTAEWTRTLSGQALHRAFMFSVSLIALYLMLRDGAWLTARLTETADRLFGDPAERLATRAVDAVRASVNGTVLVAVAEGVLIGAAYLLAGVPGWLLFTMLTMAFAMVPLGAWIAFSLAALTLLFTDGNVWGALGVVGWGALVMLIGDYLVWPRLVGGIARLPFLFALIGIFGGVQTFGLIGLFLGPVVMAMLLTIWREWLIGGGRAAKA